MGHTFENERKDWINLNIKFFYTGWNVIKKILLKVFLKVYVWLLDPRNNSLKSPVTKDSLEYFRALENFGTSKYLAISHYNPRTRAHTRGQARSGAGRRQPRPLTRPQPWWEADESGREGRRQDQPNCGCLIALRPENRNEISIKRGGEKEISVVAEISSVCIRI